MKTLSQISQTAVKTLVLAGLFAAAFTHQAKAQTPESPGSAAQPRSAAPPLVEDGSSDRTYKLKFAESAQDANELLTALRNTLEPRTRIFLVPSTFVIVVHGTEQEQARAAKLLPILDRPHPRYRLTYTLTELDGSRKVGVERFTVVVLSGHHTQLKQGSRLPILTGADAGAQFTYLEVGINIDAAMVESEGGGTLKSRIENSSVAPDSISASNPHPVTRQTFLEGSTALQFGKVQALGAMDVPYSTHHFDVDVVLEPAN